MLDSTEEVERLLIAAAPGALPLLERLEAELPGGRRGPARPADLDLRRRLARSASQTSRSPSSVRNGSTAVERRARAARSARRARPSRPSAPRRRAPRGSARRSRPPGRRTRRRAPTGGRRRSSCRSRVGGADEVDLHEPRGPREERVHRDLDPGREHAADVLARRAETMSKFVRGAEVDDDARRAVALARGDGVDDPVRPRPRAGRRSGSGSRSSRPGPTIEQRRLQPALGDPLPLALQRRHGRARGRSRRRPRGRRAPPSVTPSSSPVRLRSVASRKLLARARVAVEQAEHRLRVADVDREQHGRARRRA